MEYTELKIFTSSEGIEKVSDMLISLGVGGFVIEDKKDFEDFLQNYTQYWNFVDEELLKQKSGESCVIVYIPINESRETTELIEKGLENLRKSDKSGELGRLVTAQNLVKDEDWANNWKQYYKPIKIGERLVVCPLWEDIKPENDEILLKIDPGMAFGTGTHSSTKLCLLALQEYIKKDDKVLDIGCGSGILSVGALLFGAKNAVCADIDEIACTVTKENAALNGFGENELKVYCSDVLKDKHTKDKILFEKYDVIFANIVADVIINLSDLFVKALKEKGNLITSGIIDTRWDDVLQKLTKSGLTLVEKKEESGWVCGVFSL